MEIQIKNKETNKKCPFCKNQENIKVASIIETPKLLGCTDQTPNEDVFVDFDLFECKNCSLIFTQIIKDANDYSEMHSEATGKIWTEHHETFAEYIIKQTSEINKILEIGPSSRPITRMLNNKLNKEFQHIDYCDIIKKLPFELKNNENYINEKFPLKNNNNTYDLIFGSHVFEHADDVDGFLKGAISLLKENGVFMISIPNFEFWIQNKFWNGITHEHTIYPFIQHIDLLAKKNNINLEFTKFKNHSIFFTFKKGKEYTQNKLENTKKELAINWCESIINSVKIAEDQIVNDKEIIIAGASHLAQYPILISNKLKDKIKIVIDNSDTKVNKRLYGTSVIDKKFEYIQNIEQPIILLFSSPYREEMITQIKQLNSNSHIIKP